MWVPSSFFHGFFFFHRPPLRASC
ncbi:unnamed protein product [Victoria cruziana]